MDINEQINYQFPFEWKKGLGQEGPSVNLLLKYIIEGNVSKMEETFKKGASLKKVNQCTFKLVLYKIIRNYNNSYEIFECLFKNGFTRVVKSNETHEPFDDECLTTYGYATGMFATAYYYGKYKLAYFFAENGFWGTPYIRTSENSSNYIKIENYLVEREDVDTIEYLFSLSLPRDDFMDAIYGDMHYDDKIYNIYIDFDVKRISFILDPCKYKEIQFPSLYKEKLFGGKAIKMLNQLLIHDYEDRCNSQDKFIQKYYKNKKDWENICYKQNKFNSFVLDAMVEISKDF